MSGILMPNVPQFVMAYFAILKLGAVVVAINPLFVPREIERLINDAGIETMIVLSNYYPIFQQIRTQTYIRTILLAQVERDGAEANLAVGDYLMNELIDQHKPQDRPQVEVTADDIALIQYSGGTTGMSKGATALHRNLVVNALQFRHWLVNTEDNKEVMLLAIPLYHVYGMVVGMIISIRLGATMILVANPRDLKDLLDNIQRYKATLFPGVPTLYNSINNHPDVLAGKYDLSTIKACISGSAPLLRETKEKFEALTGGKLVEGYGSI